MILWNLFPLISSHGKISVSFTAFCKNVITLFIGNIIPQGESLHFTVKKKNDKNLLVYKTLQHSSLCDHLQWNVLYTTILYCYLYFTKLHILPSPRKRTVTIYCSNQKDFFKKDLLPIIFEILLISNYCSVQNGII